MKVLLVEKEELGGVPELGLHPHQGAARIG